MDACATLVRVPPDDRHAVPESASWHARLHMRFERVAGRTRLASREHVGPLVVQKPLYPEDDAVCQAIVVHPPGGIANGDRLELDVAAGRDAHVQITTPGAAKWYRSTREKAHQSVTLAAGEGAAIEWMPQGSIVYDGAEAAIDLHVALAPDATFIGWDIVSLGRQASGERFVRGSVRQRTEIVRDGALVWSERVVLVGSDPLLRAGCGLGGCAVFGTLVAAAADQDHGMLVALRGIGGFAGEGAVTCLPGALVARYVGDSMESAFAYFVAAWRALRPLILGRPAVPARIWKT